MARALSMFGENIEATKHAAEPSNEDASSASDEDETSRLLQGEDRHDFIFSNSGRPIFSRHGQPHSMANISALMYTLLVFSDDSVGEVPRTIHAENLTICLRCRPIVSLAAAPGASQLARSPTIQAIASRRGEPTRVLHIQLEILHLQMRAWTTGKWERQLLDSPNLDTDSTMAGTLPSFITTLDRFNTDPDHFLQSTEPLLLDAPLRTSATQALQQAVSDSGALFGIIAAGHHLIATAHNTARKPNPPPTPWDLLILLNFIASSSQFRSKHAGSPAWTPLCLPESHPSAFRHVYINFPISGDPLFVALAAVNQAAFFQVHAVSEPLMLSLEASGALLGMKASYDLPSWGRYPVTSLPPPRPEHQNLQGLLWHMIIKDTARAVYIETTCLPDLDTPCYRKALILDYMHLHSSMWATAPTKGPAKLQWRATSNWILMGSINKDHEVYCVFDPLTTKEQVSLIMHCSSEHLLQNPALWIRG